MSKKKITGRRRFQRLEIDRPGGVFENLGRYRRVVTSVSPQGNIELTPCWISEAELAAGKAVGAAPKVGLPCGLGTAAALVAQANGSSLATTPRPIGTPDHHRVYSRWDELVLDGKVKSSDRVDTALLSFVHAFEQGLVHYSRDTMDVNWLVAQIALAFPNERVAVLLATHRQAAQTFEELNRFLHERVTLWHRGGSSTAGCHRIAVGTYAAIAEGNTQYHEIVVLPDVVTSLGKDATCCLDHADAKRMIGLIDSGVQVSLFEHQLLVRRFGFATLGVPRHGSCERATDVVWIPFKHQSTLPKASTLFEVKLHEIWYGVRRNRLIARAAKAVLAEDTTNLAATLGRTLELPPAAKVAILVENSEHACQLAALLPHWRIVGKYRDLAISVGKADRRHLETHYIDPTMLPSMAPSLDYRGRQCGKPIGFIIPYSGLSKLRLDWVDVLIRADAGRGMPDRLRCLFESSRITSRSLKLTLLDIADSSHPELCRSTQTRRQDYKSFFRTKSADQIIYDANQWSRARAGRRA